jgi:hypothetical protein
LLDKQFQMQEKIKLPNFIIAGAPKCGTTSVSRYLAQHPDVYIPEKEMNVYSFLHREKEFRSTQIERIDSLEKYQAFFSFKNNPPQHIGEKSVSYTYHLWNEKVIQNILKYHPRAKQLKIIIILRQPVERMFSQYVFNCGFDEKLSFEDAIQFWPERQKQGWIPAYDYFGGSLYSQSILNFKKHFKNTGIFFYDDLKGNPKAFMNNIFDFLEIKNTIDIDFSEKHNTGALPSGNMGKLFRKAGRSKLLQNISETKFGQRLKSKIKNKTFEKANLEPDLKSELTKHFEEDIKKLEDILNKDLSNWLK